ncbi:16221_t:CDS:2 [Acaulospora morrowiae]|uniref:16221_t:CDS:1 n=1 Tax=Acaulospora morrowiae TaxID=94023 RepID=A0A9N8VNN8_9GLOM|nr:16221_t:CDS:2 [Acaulospora morrowiae]
MGNNKSCIKKKPQDGQDFRYINGRRYHNEETASYLLSSDMEEIDRQQLQHYCFKHIFKCNVSAPIEKKLTEGSRVLDVGCGTGIWVLELSSKYENSEFFGVDMSPVFPSQIKPFNSNFIKANVLDGLPFSSDEFDYVHLSFLNASFTDDQWQNIVIPELIRVLKPNGWLEFYEVDVVQINGGPLIERISGSLQKLCYNAGINPRLPNLLKQWLSPYKCLKDIEELVAYPFLGKWKGEIVDELEIDNDLPGKCDDNDDTGRCNTGCENFDSDFSIKNTNVKSKYEVELGLLLKEVIKMYYTLDAENLSMCMGTSKEVFLDMLEECFEREMSEYDTRMKFMRVMCRKDDTIKK